MSYFPRKYKEALEIQKHPDNLNRDSDYNISRIWNTALLKKDFLFSTHALTPPPFPSLQRLHKESFPEQQFSICALVALMK